MATAMSSKKKKKEVSGGFGTDVYKRQKKLESLPEEVLKLFYLNELDEFVVDNKFDFTAYVKYVRDIESKTTDEILEDIADLRHRIMKEEVTFNRLFHTNWDSALKLITRFETEEMVDKYAAQQAVRDSQEPKATTSAAAAVVTVNATSAASKATTETPAAAVVSSQVAPKEMAKPTEVAKSGASAIVAAGVAAVIAESSDISAAFWVKLARQNIPWSAFLDAVDTARRYEELITALVAKCERLEGELEATSRLKSMPAAAANTAASAATATMSSASMAATNAAPMQTAAFTAALTQ